MSELRSADDVLSVSNLSISYRRRARAMRVVSDVSFSIRRGEAYGLVGESGCGKSTIAMAVMAYLADNALIDGGSIRLLGDEVIGARAADLREWRASRVAMVYQDPGSSLNPTMRVGRQLAEVYRYHDHVSWDAANASALTMLERVQFADPRTILERYPHELSGGQQQRVMIAMALAANPALLILDEPTTGLDATVEAEILDLVEELLRDIGTAALFISHNLAIVSRLCDRVGVLYAGRLVEEGPASEVLHTPHHPYSIGLLNSIPHWGATKDHLRLLPIPGDPPALGQIPSGCAFASRCAIAEDACLAAPPPLAPCSGVHSLSACLRRDDAADLAAVVAKNEAADGPAPVATPVRIGREAVVEVTDVIKRFSAHGTTLTAVSDLSLTLHRGEILGLVGESGSGKTTLARTIAGLYRADGGAVRVGDATTRSRRERASFLQMVFQNPDTALNAKFRVARLLGRSVKRLNPGLSADERQAKVLDVARSVKLQESHLDLLPGALSGGLKQRVAIGRAFTGDPTVVVLDEPASALDVSVQATILNLLVDLQREHDLAYLFISHDLSVVRYLSDRIAVMYLGELVEIGPAESVMRPPHHPYTEVLLSANAAAIAAGRARIRLRGPSPSLANPPSGCRFHTRCPRSLGELCATVAPPMQVADAGHQYRCHIEPSALATLQSLRPDAAAARDAETTTDTDATTTRSTRGHS
ncbi:MAG: ABC transporter ATP-binding protein [Actinomycetales bacterium]|nr:ABC transporter ATP-binding protein [Actinomycetales bacterium]